MLPCRFDGGACFLSTGVIPPRKSHHCRGIGHKKRPFFHVSLHFKDWFSNYLKFLIGAPGFSVYPGEVILHCPLVYIHYFTKMLWFVLLCSMLLESGLGKALDADSPGSESWLCELWSSHFTSLGQCPPHTVHLLGWSRV